MKKVAGGGSDGFGVEWRGSLSEEDSRSAQCGGVANDSAEVAGVGNFGKNNEGSFRHLRKWGVLRFSGNREIAAVKMKAKKE